jgi:hypothetical protein
LFLTLIIGLIALFCGRNESITTEPDNNEDFVKVSEFKKYVHDGDWSPAVEKAIQTAIKQNTNLILIDHTIGIKSTIEIPTGITIKGYSNSGYFNGKRWFTDENVKVKTPKIIAEAKINGPMMKLLDGSNQEGIKLEGIVLDANNNAEYGLSALGGNLKERNLYLEEIGIQGAVKDGIRLVNILTTKINNCNISANNGYGIHFEYGVSDSLLTNNYIHGNQKGGIKVSNGSHYNQIIGGRVEDNYGEGILIDQSNGIILTSIILHMNNNPGILVRNGSSVLISNSQLAKNSEQEINYSSNLVAIGENTIINIANSQFTSDKNRYNTLALDEAKVYISDSILDDKFFNAESAILEK